MYHSNTDYHNFKMKIKSCIIPLKQEQWRLQQIQELV
jgi:hypothetical protein